MYGKLQVYGIGIFYINISIIHIGTALKILFGSSESPRKFELKRNEVISLINTLGKYSVTLKIIDEFFARRRF